MLQERSRREALDSLTLGLRNYWYPTFRSADLGTAPVGIKRLGEDLVLWRDVAGRPRLFRDACAHRGARLSLGQVHGDILQCWYHGWQYDVTGQCRLIPTEGESFAGTQRMRVSSYPAEDRGGLIWAYFGDMANVP
ncbi:MAG: Rieske 2Fe-2S domain-containing protein, partial [Chloroflexi bacterium]|nr:Rieske 2Fe-2S domain-containing protein [Chloroflexota bacterium]